MNKLSFIAVLFLVNAAFATTFLKGTPSSPIFAQLKKIESTTFGKNLLDTIALQVENKVPLADISKLLANLKADLENQQVKADELQAEREAECEKAIAEYNRRIDEANRIIAETTARIAVLVEKIAALEDEIKGLEADLASTKQQLADARAANVTATNEYNERQRKFAGILDAVEIITNKLKSERDQPEEQLEFATALLALSKIGKSNPIAALAQVAATLPKEQWERAVQIFNSLRQSVETKRDNDIAAEQARLAAFYKLEAHLEKTIANIESTLEQRRAELAENEEDLANTRARKAAAEAELEAATNGLAEKTAQCKKWTEEYNRDTAKRTEEISIVEKVQQIFANRI